MFAPLVLLKVWCAPQYMSCLRVPPFLCARVECFAIQPISLEVVELFRCLATRSHTVSHSLCDRARAAPSLVVYDLPLLMLSAQPFHSACTQCRVPLQIRHFPYRLRTGKHSLTIQRFSFLPSPTDAKLKGAELIRPAMLDLKQEADLDVRPFAFIVNLFSSRV